MSLRSDAGSGDELSKAISAYRDLSGFDSGESSAQPEVGIELPLGLILKQIPEPFTEKHATVDASRPVFIAIPDLLVQLKKGRVAISLATVAGCLPASVLKEVAFDDTTTQVTLPLSDVVKAVDPALLRAGAASKDVGGKYNLATLRDPFKRAQAPETPPPAAAQPPVPPPPSAVAPPPPPPPPLPVASVPVAPPLPPAAPKPAPVVATAPPVSAPPAPVVPTAAPQVPPPPKPEPVVVAKPTVVDVKAPTPIPVPPAQKPPELKPPPESPKPPVAVVSAVPPVEAQRPPVPTTPPPKPQVPVAPAPIVPTPEPTKPVEVAAKPSIPVPAPLEVAAKFSTPVPVPMDEPKPVAAPVDVAKPPEKSVAEVAASIEAKSVRTESAPVATPPPPAEVPPVKREAPPIRTPTFTGTQIPEYEAMKTVEGEIAEVGALASANVNIADADQLLTIPGMDHDLANAIVSGRLQQGPYKSVFDVYDRVDMSRETFERITGMPFSAKHKHRASKLATKLEMSPSKMCDLNALSEAIGKAKGISGCVICDKEGLIVAEHSVGQAAEALSAIAADLIAHSAKNMSMVGLNSMSSISISIAGQMFTIARTGEMYLTVVHDSNRITGSRLKLIHLAAFEIEWAFSRRIFAA